VDPAKKSEERTALVTGGTSGIGLAAAEACAALGMRVAVCSRNIEAVEEQLRERFFLTACDVRSSEDVERTVRTVFDHFGRIDILINAAGVSMPEPLALEEVPVELWDRIVNTNTRGTFLFCRAVLPVMKSRNTGQIINILSTGAFRSNANNAPYSASKYAVRAVNEALMEETKETGIKISSISPGPVATNIWSHKKRNVSEEEKSRMVRPEDIGEIVSFLVSRPEYVHIDNITVVPKFPKN
jgi:NADP-dependent 3-hydroxy acid dehydrogenase YdfG